MSSSVTSNLKGFLIAVVIAVVSFFIFFFLFPEFSVKYLGVSFKSSPEVEQKMKSDLVEFTTLTVDKISDSVSDFNIEKFLEKNKK